LDVKKGGKIPCSGPEQGLLDKVFGAFQKNIVMQIGKNSRRSDMHIHLNIEVP
jgi:hypothetical protein